MRKKQKAKEWKIIQKQLITDWENHVSPKPDIRTDGQTDISNYRVASLLKSNGITRAFLLMQYKKMNYMIGFWGKCFKQKQKCSIIIFAFVIAKQK